MKSIAVMSLLLLVTSCASMFRGERQEVRFVNGEEGKVTKVKTPDGVFEVDGVKGEYVLTRSTEPVPIKLYCADGKKRDGFIESSFDHGVGTALNILGWGIGAIVAIPIDRANNKAYDLETVDIGKFCKNSERAVASEK